MRQALIDEFSYASEAHSLGRILAIRAVETMSGQPFLKKLYLDYQRENLPPESFWGEVINRLDLDVKIHAGTLQNVPATAPGCTPPPTRNRLFSLVVHFGRFRVAIIPFGLFP